jgi:hypothetical protein
MREHLTAMRGGGDEESSLARRSGEASLDRDTVMEWMRIQRDDPSGGRQIVRVTLSHVGVNRQIGEQLGVLEMSMFEGVVSDSIALKIYQRAELDKRGRGGPEQQYVLHAFSDLDAGGRAADCIYFWIRSQTGSFGGNQIDSIAATPDTMLQQAHALIRDLHELSIEKDRVAAESQAAFYRSMTDFMAMRSKEEERLRLALERGTESIEKTREAIWKHENESKRTDAEIAMKQSISNALHNVVPALLSYISGADVRDHDNPSSRQLFGLLKGLKEETFFKMLEPLNDFERSNVLVWYKNHCAFEEDLAAKGGHAAPAPTPVVMAAPETYPAPPVVDVAPPVVLAPVVMPSPPPPVAPVTAAARKPRKK